MTAGAPCIISGYGSLGEVPDHAVRKVRVLEHEVEDLRAALCELAGSPELRRRLSEAALSYVREEHDLENIAAQYAMAIELSAADRVARDTDWVEGACAALETCADPAAADAMVASWAALRVQARQHLKDPERRVIRLATSAILPSEKRGRCL
jgi:hypothetical protein